jgi:sialic acid synthase SpsE
MIEKHLTLDRTMSGPDHSASLEPAEFRQMVEAIRHVEAALGDGAKVPRAVEQDTARVARKSLHARHDLVAGAAITEDSVIIARPNTGLPPAMLPRIVGRTLRRRISSGSPIRLEDLV